MAEQRSHRRVVFERGQPAYMMAIDGTWRRTCVMEDASDGGAKLTVEGPLEGLQLNEFFLLLSSTGLAYRRCGLAWVNGDQLGVTFLKRSNVKRNAQTKPKSEAPA
ncbi:PilZ domain-containing protein [Bradyrhizobium sp. AUGA SZCCT0177]|uniref:PilZ domain-containing protein n=1 Tax=unclassified Bradyrhizobium TaxID=2631580 RepID=UPI001BA485A6|nr:MULTISPECIES: PilZ domain-containing protein [unclassified Bradyrhizobium]MBR1238475.1 PilZ domain-containing protein [Bradyrhizobium sp. AUGA SZCCT0182]MBR1281624.1 PilZ domain-containing protein [Bradyrhizobium sp. AUGA SZCCT0177]